MRKGKIFDSVVRQTPIPSENTKKVKGQHKAASKNFDYTVSDRLRTVRRSNDCIPTSVV